MNGNGNAQSRHETVLDDTTRHVARVYAQALLDAAGERQQAAAVLDELNALVHDVLNRDPALEVLGSASLLPRPRFRSRWRHSPHRPSPNPAPPP